MSLGSVLSDANKSQGTCVEGSISMFWLQSACTKCLDQPAQEMGMGVMVRVLREELPPP